MTCTLFFNWDELDSAYEKESIVNSVVVVHDSEESTFCDVLTEGNATQQLQVLEEVNSWLTYHTPEGDPYYYNTRTGETTWDFQSQDNIGQQPPVLEESEHWVTYHTAEGDPYYHNTQTGETTWIFPSQDNIDHQQSLLQETNLWVSYDTRECAKGEYDAVRVSGLSEQLWFSLLACSAQYAIQRNDLTPQVLAEYARMKFCKRAILTADDLMRMPCDKAAVASQTKLPAKLFTRLAQMMFSYPPPSLAPKHYRSAADAYLDWLFHTTSAQTEVVVADIYSMLHNTIRSILPPDVFEFQLKPFGSRHYGCCVPSSDVDIVIQVSTAQTKKEREEILLNIYDCLSYDHRLSDLKSVIDIKTTIEFKYAHMGVDLTICRGDALESHGPSKFTDYVRRRLQEVPCKVHSAICLFVDSAKRFNLCRARNTAKVGNRLKACHWILFFLAWYKIGRVSSAMHVTDMLHACVLFYMGFPFKKFAVDVESEQQFLQRSLHSAADDIMWLEDPIIPERNLAWRMNEAGMASLRLSMQGLLLQLKEPDTFFQNARKYWDSYAYAMKA